MHPIDAFNFNFLSGGHAPVPLKRVRGGPTTVSKNMPENFSVKNLLLISFPSNICLRQEKLD